MMARRYKRDSRGRFSGTAAGGSGSRGRVIKTKSPVMDTILQKQPKAAAKEAAKAGKNPLQQRVAANASAVKSMRRSKAGRDRTRATLSKLF